MGKKIDFGSDETFIKNYQELKSSRKMGELYGCDKTSVLNHAKKIGFNVKDVQTPKLSKEDKKRIIQCYESKTSAELAKEYNVPRGMITKVWYDANLKGKRVIHYPKEDITNQKFGRLTVLYPTEERDCSGSIKWFCECSCGGYIKATLSLLKQGKIKSCGCLSKENLELGRGRYSNLQDQKFGKLKALERCEDKIYANNKTAVQWLCQCVCGRFTKVTASNLTTGNTQSCGFCGENSHGNTKIDILLTAANIPFVREKRFKTCKDKACLPFDFFVDDKYLIEYDGNYHFDSTKGFFNTQRAQEHDKIKTEWCLKNNIPLIRIPYTKYKTLILEDLLLETSNFIVKNNADT